MVKKTTSAMNKDYLTSLDQIREYFKVNGVISLQDFLDEFPSTSDLVEDYQPADYRCWKGSISLDQLSIDFLENISNKKITEINAYSYFHRCFDLRKYFEREGVFFIINISDDDLKDVGGRVFVVKTEQPLSVPSSTNTLTMVKVTPENESFITYVNHRIAESSVDLIMGFLE